MNVNPDKRLPVLLVIALFLICAGGMVYFITNFPKATNTKEDTKGDAKGDTNGDAKGKETLASRIAASEQKVTSIEAQIKELQGKSNTGTETPFLLHQVEALSQKVEALEKRGQQLGVESEAKPAPPTPAVAFPKIYHTVQKGETLLKIGKKYGIAVEELRKLNNLSNGQSIRIGQKLLVSAER